MPKNKPDKPQAIPNMGGQTDDEQPQKTLAKQEFIANPYEVLGLQRTATLDDIKKAYFQKVREFPPERNPEEFKRIRAAYDALRTPEAKAATDMFMLYPPSPYQPYKRPPTYTLSVSPDDWQAALDAKTDLKQTDFRNDFRNIDI